MSTLDSFWLPPLFDARTQKARTLIRRRVGYKKVLFFAWFIYAINQRDGFEE